MRHVNYKLKPSTINAAKPSAKPFTLTDGGGLYLEILPGGSKVWRYSYRMNGKRPKLTIGPYPQIGISDARNQHETARDLVAKGIDPAAKKQVETLGAESASEAQTRFAAFARRWVTETLFYRSAGYRAQCIRFLDTHINPHIGEKAMDEVKPRDVLEIITGLRHIPVTAERCRSLIQQIYNFAIRNLVVESNPATAIRGAVVVPPAKHHRHLVGKQIGRFWLELDRQRGALIITVYAAKLLLLTMVRKSELTLAKWSEFNLDAGIWDVPAERMKMRLPHRVYLSRQAMELLRQLHRVSGHGEYVFPTRYVNGHGRPIGSETLNHFFKRLDLGVPDFSPHGTRGTASTLLREHGVRSEVVELLLAHKEKDKSAAAYNHAELAAERLQAMQLLADLVDQSPTSAITDSMRQTIVAVPASD